MRSVYRSGAVTAAVTIVVLVAGGAVAQSPPAADPPAETVFKNIKVLTGAPRSEVLADMHFMRVSLGVRCDFCHVAENEKFELDDKPEKETARRMITMVGEINRTTFEGRTRVTCLTCHRGSTRPAFVPDLPEGPFDDSINPPVVVASPLPSLDAVLAAYDRAAGGDAARAVRTRHSIGTQLEPKFVDEDTPRARMVARAERSALEIFQKSPDKILITARYADGTTDARGFDGTSAWIKTPRGVRSLGAAETARLRALADPSGNLRLRERYHDLRVAGRDTLRDRAVVVVQGLDAQNRRVRFSFDERNGLLLRALTLNPIRVGADPVALDYDDYRRIGPANVPFRIDTFTLDDSRRGLTQTFARVRDDEPVDDALFARPPSPPAPSPSPSAGAH